MKLATFTAEGRTRIGRVLDTEDALVDLAAAAPALPTTMLDLLAGGAAALGVAAAAEGPAIALSSVRLEAPIPRPPKFLGIGMNYGGHLAEAQRERPPNQIWFAKQPLSVVGPFDDIVRPNVSRALDYECELGIVIGQVCRNVSVADAPKVVAGYLVCNDGSVRDWQRRSPTAMLGKSFDRTSPIGPWIVTPDEVGDPHKLALRTWVNGELRQDANTDQLLFSCWEMIAELSTAFTLEVGDILATGTPAGVGALMTPPRFLAPGDEVRMEIERLGSIRNLVVSET